MDYCLNMSEIRLGRDGRTARSRAHGHRKRWKVYPFRILALILMIGILIELILLMCMPDYSEEREQARQAYLLAESENQRLQKELKIARQSETIEDSARKQGYTYYGETIYVPIINGETSEADEK